MRVATALLGAAILLAPLSAQAAAPFTEQQLHCAAWKTKKTMFLVKKLEPVGVNCDITAAFESGSDGMGRISARFPIKGFNSGESGRDEEVVKILKGDKQADLLFQSAAMSLAEWKQFLAKPEGRLKGTLNFGGVDFPVEFNTTHARTGGKLEVQGVFVSTYTAFKIAPPTVAGGAVAKVQDYLELHVRLQSDKVAGAAPLLVP